MHVSLSIKKVGQIIADLVHCVIREIENCTKIRIIQEERSQWKFLGKKLKENFLSCNETEGGRYMFSRWDF